MLRGVLFFKSIEAVLLADAKRDKVLDALRITTAPVPDSAKPNWLPSTTPLAVNCCPVTSMRLSALKVMGPDQLLVPFEARKVAPCSVKALVPMSNPCRSSTVPLAKRMAALSAPKPCAFEVDKVPAFTSIGPVKLLAWVSSSVPAPSLYKPPEPVTCPASVPAEARTKWVGACSCTAPVNCRSFKVEMLTGDNIDALPITVVAAELVKRDSAWAAPTESVISSVLLPAPALTVKDRAELSLLTVPLSFSTPWAPVLVNWVSAPNVIAPL